MADSFNFFWITEVPYRTPGTHHAFEYFHRNKYKMPVKLSTLKKRANAHRPHTRSMTAATKTKRQEAAAKARAGKGKKLEAVNENAKSNKSKSGSRKSKGGFFSW
jgi:hypothetical protein